MDYCIKSVAKCHLIAWPSTYYNIHYRPKVWGHIEMSLFLKEKHCTFNEYNPKPVPTLKKHTPHIANVANDHSSCKCPVQHSHRCTEPPPEDRSLSSDKSSGFESKPGPVQDKQDSLGYFSC